MIRAKFPLTLLIAGFLFAGILQPASAQVVGAFALGTVGYALNGLKKRANEIIDRATNAGNAVVDNAARRALELIEAFEKSQSKLLGEAFDGIAKERVAWVREIDNILSRLERGEEIIFEDLQAITLQWASIIKDLPLADSTPGVFRHSPMVILPTGEDIVPVSVYGPRIGRAIKSIYLDEDRMEFDILNDNQIFIKLKRSALDFNERKSSFVRLVISYDQNDSAWYNIFASENVAQRKLTLWLLPRQMAEAKITAVTSVEGWDRREIKIRAHTSGRDQAKHFFVQIPDANKAQGWVLDKQRLAVISKNATSFWRFLGGYASHCGGLVANSMTKVGFQFHIRKRPASPLLRRLQ